MDLEIELISDAEDEQIEWMSTTEDLEIERMSAAEDLEIDVPPLFKKSYGCIFRASAQIKYGRESDFEPKLVSIGPYYHGRGNLERMEDIKVQYMSDILNMRPDRESNTDRVPVEPFMRFERHARRFYKEKFDLSYVKFVQMLVLDSFFVIRIMLALGRNRPPLDLNMKVAVSDLLLLENQIPLFFIEQVWYWLYPDGGRFRNILFDDLIRSTFMQLDLPWRINFDRLPRLPVNPDHLLHLYWKISEESIKKKIKEDHANPNQLMIKWLQKVRRGRCRGPSRKLIVNATELHQMAGIRFKNVETDRYNGSCVEFSKGIMRMPCLKIDSNQTTLLVNLIAFENSMLPFRQTISTYMKFMDDLIDSDKDMEFLQKSRVIYNTLSSHTNAATFFNDIADLCLIDYDENPFSELFEDVNKYYNSNWNRSWANLRQNYFNSPWAGLSVLAAVTLLFLAGAQTYYTVFPKN